jgi:hypothetical protein
MHNAKCKMKRENETVEKSLSEVPRSAGLCPAFADPTSYGVAP